MRSFFFIPVIVFCAFTCRNTDVPLFEIHNGINISHWLSQSDRRGESRSSYFTRADVAFLAGLGYDHLRIPIDEEQMFDSDGNREPEAFSLLHNALEWCAEFRLRAVVDLHILRSHHFNHAEKPLFVDPAAQEKFYACWRTLSGELNKYPNHMVAYELMNEPVADDPEIWNVIVNRCAATVRELEPERTIVIGSNRWQSYHTVKDLRLPENDAHIIIGFHYYEPFLLTHYRASWTSQKNLTVPVHYPGQLVSDEDMEAGGSAELARAGQRNETYDMEKIESHFRQVLDVAQQYGLKVYCGEYGCIDEAPHEDKIRWYRDMNTLFNACGIARANWDYKGSFAILRDGVEQQEMLEAILGKQFKNISADPKK
ncbi:MAG: glycoside hydrolase family 5 protein [Bacteroidales bacterium]|jgi:endoglucanase|nr:glycoside hydrolase family 5 protein [Bacteroidales bacterium]